MLELQDIFQRRFPNITLSAIDRELMRCSHLNRYDYPWELLTSDLRKAGKSLLMMGYGSLLNKVSAGLTLDSQIVERGIPVVAFGAKRVFNYPFHTIPKRYGPPYSPKHIAALNSIITWDSKDIMNGILLEIPIDNLDAIMVREQDYNLVPVPVLHWDGILTSFVTAYILSYDSIDVNRDIRPHIKYYNICREGASSVDKVFLKTWLLSTFLNDGVSTVFQWETKPIQDDK